MVGSGPKKGVEKADKKPEMVAAKREIREASTEACEILREFGPFKALTNLSKSIKPLYKDFKEGYTGLTNLENQADDAGKTVAANMYEMEKTALKLAYPEFAQRYNQEHQA